MAQKWSSGQPELLICWLIDVGKISASLSLRRGDSVKPPSNPDENLFFALLTDFHDALERSLPGDDGLLAVARAGIAALNDKLAADHGGDWTKLHALVADKEKIEQRLKSWMAEWERLGEELQA